MWKEYEKQLHRTLSENYPDCEIEYDDSIFGIFSKTERQIDFAIRGNLAGKRILGIVDCKYYNKKINIKVVESFIGMAQDVNANFGLIITNKGYSEAAKNRVKYSNLKLDVLEFSELNEIDITVDYFFNQAIKGLQLSKYEFYRRWEQNTGFFDPSKSSYKKRILCFKEGFADTEYFAYKKILENSARAYRDFEQLESIKVYMPAKKNNSGTENRNIKTLFYCTISRVELEKFINLKFSKLRDDIKLWRSEFLGLLSKKIINEFADKYVLEKRYDEYEKITCG